MGILRNIAGGNALGARLIRSSGWTVMGYGGSQAIRLASNLILTRLLFPEAFGVMALITVFLVGLTMLSDVGIAPSIQHSARGDDPDFVNTAWTIQVMRGTMLWLACFALGIFAAKFYGNADLQTMLPVAGLSLLIAGFDPTRIETASRHLTVGLVTLLDLVAQVVGLAITLFLAWQIQSVWALVIGGVATVAFRLVVMTLFLPGQRNSFRWDKTAAGELINFGKWIFLSTLCGFVLVQGDKAILGKYLTLDKLGIYNIGYFLAHFPQALASVLMARVLIPLHRESPPDATPENFARVRRMRFILTGAVFCLQFALAFSGVWLVSFLYDDRFFASGSVLVAITCMSVPYLIGMTYDYAALGKGDSRGVFNLLLSKVIIQTALFLAGMEWGGLTGALIGIWVSQIVVHPLVIRLARRHGAWDPMHDMVYFVVGLGLTALALWINWGALTLLSGF